MAVVTQSARRIMDIVSQAADQIKAGNSSEAVVLLKQIQGDARTMHKETQQLIQQLKLLKEHYKKEVEKSTYKISEVTIKKSQLEDEMQKAEIELKAKQDRVRDLERRRSLAESSRDTARRERNRQKDKKGAMIGTAVGVGILGGILTIATAGIATPLVAGATVAATAGCSVAAAEHAEKEKKAEDEIKQYNREISNINDDIRSCNQRISNMRGEILQLLITLNEYEEKCRKCEGEKKHVQGTIAFLQESQSFWGEFENIVELRSIKTDILYKLIRKAESKENIDFLQRRGTQKMATTWVDAWEQLRKEAQSGAGYIFKISFRCTHCNKEFNDLPCTKDGNFICSYCNQTNRALEDER